METNATSSTNFIYVHLIWISTPQCLRKIMVPERKALHGFINQYASDKMINLLAFQASEDHVHALVQLHHTQSVHMVTKPLMDESVSFINLLATSTDILTWEPNYYAFSVSPNTLSKAKDYINHQSTIHQKITTAQELEKLTTMAVELPI